MTFKTIYTIRINTFPHDMITSFPDLIKWFKKSDYKEDIVTSLIKLRSKLKIKDLNNF